jgi:hypothetical protein
MLHGVTRFDDSGELGAAEETPQGGLAIPAFLTRTGVFDYEQEDGRVIREYRPPEEVFAADSLATLPNAPLCNEHPTEAVQPRNFRKYTVGHIEAGTVKQADDKVAARAIFQEAKTLDDIRAGRKRELSCGYNCDIDETSGVAPDGERYDRIQRNIRYNHVALVPDGRAGPEVRLRLDNAGNQKKGVKMEKIEIIGGVEYTVGTPPHADAVARRDKARTDALAKTKALAKERDAARADADAAKAKAAKLEKALAEANSPARLDHAVRVRGAVIRRAQVALGAEYKADGKSLLAIKLDAVKAYHPEIKLDGKSKDYVNALFRAIPADGSERRDANGPMHLDGNNTVRGGKRLPASLRQPPKDFKKDAAGGPTMDQYRARRNDAEEARHRRPLAVSKSNPARELDGYPAVQGSMLENMK